MRVMPARKQFKRLRTLEQTKKTQATLVRVDRRRKKRVVKNARAVLSGTAATCVAITVKNRTRATSWDEKNTQTR
jgi:hypothetical protein